MIPVSLLVRRAPALDSAPATPSSAPAQPEMFARAGAALAAIIILLLTNFFVLRHHWADHPHRELRRQVAAYDDPPRHDYSVEALAGMGGRIAFGLLGDRFGAKRVLVLGLLAQAFGALGYVFVASSPRSTRWRRCSASSMPAPCRCIPCWSAKTFRCG